MSVGQAVKEASQEIEQAVGDLRAEVQQMRQDLHTAYPDDDEGGGPSQTGTHGVAGAHQGAARPGARRGAGGKEDRNGRRESSRD